MANIMQNRIDAVLKAEELAKILDCIATAIKMLPQQGLLSLTDEERYSLTSIDVDNKAFAKDVIDVMKHSGKDILPGYINVAMIQNDLALFEQMDEIHTNLLDLLKRVLDLLRLTASEIMNVANKVYGLYESAADGAVPGAQAGYDKMKTRYKDKGTGAKPKENIPT